MGHSVCSKKHWWCCHCSCLLVVGSICRSVFRHQIFLQHLLETHCYVFAEVPDRTSKAPSWTIFIFMRGRTRTGKLTCPVVWTTSSYLGALEVMCFFINLFCAVGPSALLPLPVAHSIHWPSWRGLCVFITKSVSSLCGRSWSSQVHTNWIVGSSSSFLSCSSACTCIQVLHSTLIWAPILFNPSSSWFKPWFASFWCKVNCHFVLSFLLPYWVHGTYN